MLLEKNTPPQLLFLSGRFASMLASTRACAATAVP